VVPLGSSVASSKILGLDEQGLLSALGLLEAAAGSMEYWLKGVDENVSMQGGAAHSGMIGLNWLERGFEDYFNHRRQGGFLRAYSNGLTQVKF